MADRERFVPQRVGQITDRLVDGESWSGPHAPPTRVRAFSRLVTALFHFEMHAREQTLTEAWHDEHTPDDDRLIRDELAALLEDANYTTVTMAELDEALEQESLIPLRFDIDLEDYEDLTVDRRGSRIETVEIPKWKGLRTVEHTMTVDESVVVHSLVKPAEWFEQRGIDPADRNLQPGHRSLKQFQNVPRADIEMLLPSVQVRMRPIDTLMVGVPAVVSGIVVLFTKLAPTLGLIALLVGAWIGVRDDTPELDQTALVLLLGGAIALGGFLIRQWNKLKNRRVEYLKTLSENLYFRTVGDGPGVIHTLLSAAEQQESIEVVLAYRFLLAASPDGLTSDELDTRIEAWLAADGGDIDFEVDDAIAKLDDLDLLLDDDGRLRVRDLDDALVVLDRRWDDLFQYA
ncbi:MAG: TMEM143 family protein [Acidimicrobiales bacterium]|nr:TMEM143 family protein [Acidimicrobiales bacterium]